MKPADRRAAALVPNDLVETFARACAVCARGVRYLGDDIRHALRRWKTSPEFPGLVGRMAAGTPMDDPLFPIVWPRG